MQRFTSLSVFLFCASHSALVGFLMSFDFGLSEIRSVMDLSKALLLRELPSCSSFERNCGGDDMSSWEKLIWMGVNGFLCAPGKTMLRCWYFDWHTWQLRNVWEDYCSGASLFHSGILMKFCFCSLGCQRLENFFDIGRNFFDATLYVNVKPGVSLKFCTICNIKPQFVTSNHWGVCAVLSCVWT